MLLLINLTKLQEYVLCHGITEYCYQMERHDFHFKKLIPNNLSLTIINTVFFSNNKRNAFFFTITQQNTAQRNSCNISIELMT